MKKLTYSDIDSGSDENLKHGTAYFNNDQVLRVRVVNTDFNSNYGSYFEFLPSVLDSGILNSDTNDFKIRLGNRKIRFTELEGDDFILSLASGEFEDKITAHANIAFDNSNNGIKFGNGDVITKNPIKWTLLADRNNTDTEVPLFTAGLQTVENLFSNAQEIMVVANVEGDYVSSVIPTIAVTSFPATFTVHNGSVVVASVTFTASTDATYVVTSNASNVKVFMR